MKKDNNDVQQHQPYFRIKSIKMQNITVKKEIPILNKLTTCEKILFGGKKKIRSQALPLFF